MTQRLIVPDYIVAQIEAKKKAEDKSAKERVPKPTGWRVLVMPYKGREKTVGGVYVPDETRDGSLLLRLLHTLSKLAHSLTKIQISLGKNVSLGAKKGIGFVSVDTPGLGLSWMAERFASLMMMK